MYVVEREKCGDGVIGTVGRVYGGMRGEQVLLYHSAYYLLNIGRV